MNNFLFSVYNKIIKQSKKNFFFDDFLIPDLFLARLEIFQLNLILKGTFTQKLTIFLLLSFFDDQLAHASWKTEL